MNPCLIRFAREDDEARVEAILHQVHTLHLAWRPDIYKPCDPVLPHDAFLADVAQQHLAVAELDGAVVGLLAFARRHVASDTQVTRDVLFIDTIAVDEAHRGRGIGRQLLDFAKELARREHLDGVELQVNARNTAAYAMYRRCGFTEKSINMELL